MLRTQIRSAVLIAAGILTGALIVGSFWLGEQNVRAASSVNVSSARPFTDVPANHWAAKAVSDLAAKGVIRGDSGTVYNGDRYVTRYEAAVLLDRFAHAVERGGKPLNVTQINPKDMPKIPGGFARASLVDLVKYQYIAPNSVLLTSGNTPITAYQMSQSLAQTVARVSSRRLAPDKDQPGD